MARWRLAEPYEDIDDGGGALSSRPRDIWPTTAIDDPANIDFEELWAPRSDINSDERLRIPIGNSTDTGELLILDIKDMNRGRRGPARGDVGHDRLG